LLNGLEEGVGDQGWAKAFMAFMYPAMSGGEGGGGGGRGQADQVRKYLSSRVMK
jgi:hypothetical protein